MKRRNRTGYRNLRLLGSAEWIGRGGDYAPNFIDAILAARSPSDSELTTSSVNSSAVRVSSPSTRRSIGHG